MDVLFQGIYFRSLKSCWLLPKMHTECIMNNDDNNSTDAIQQKMCYYIRYCIMQLINQTSPGSQVHSGEGPGNILDTMA